MNKAVDSKVAVLDVLVFNWIDEFVEKHAINDEMVLIRKEQLAQAMVELICMIDETQQKNAQETETTVP